MTMGWSAAAVLGAWHGLNPAMGWLFAVAIGFQYGRAATLLRALAAIAVGHAVSVCLALALMVTAALVLPVRVLQYGGAAALFAFAAYLILRRRTHPGRPGMRRGFAELVFWSFLMSSAHGAGLMLFPVLMRGTVGPMAHAHAAHTLYGNSVNLLIVHSVAMFATMVAVALLTYRVLGVGFLRRAWINLDIIWIAALVLSGLVTLVSV
jgi:hypothetical protein